MPHVITEQGDLGLGLTPISEDTYQDAMNDKNKEKHRCNDNECYGGNDCSPE